MKNRTIILCLSVFLFGMAFGCNPLSDKAEDYMLAIQHTTDNDILIVDTDLDDSGGTLESCEALINIDGVSKTISGDDVECALVSNSKRGWFAIKLDKGLLPAQSGTVKVSIKYHYVVDEVVGDTASDESPLLDITKAKKYPIKMTSVVWDEADGGNYDYTFTLSLPQSASNANINYTLDADGVRNISVPMPGSSCAADECTYPLSTYGPGVHARLIRAVSKTGSGDNEVITPITPLLYAIGCVQTAEVVGQDGASICLPYEADDTPPDCVADPTAEGCPNSPGCLADPTAPGCESTGDPDDPDQDGIFGDEDKCPDQAEIYTFSSLRPADGVLDGCPGSTTTDPNLGEGEGGGTIDLPGMGSDGSGCSLNTAAAANPGALLLILTALAHMIVRRKR